MSGLSTATTHTPRVSVVWCLVGQANDRRMAPLLTVICVLEFKMGKAIPYQM